MIDPAAAALTVLDDLLAPVTPPARTLAGTARELVADGIATWAFDPTTDQVFLLDRATHDTLLTVILPDPADPADPDDAGDYAVTTAFQMFHHHY